MKSYAILLAFLWHATVAHAAPDRVVSTSPDKRFVVRLAERDDAAVFKIAERASGRVITSFEYPGDFNQAEHAEFVWSPKSKRVALNYQAGVRYWTMSVYEFRDGKFIEVESLEGNIGVGALEKERRRLLAEMKAPLDQSGRRIIDEWKVERWADANTAIVRLHSIRSVMISQSEEEMADLDVWIRFTVKFNGKGKFIVAKTHVLTDKEAAAEAKKEEAAAE